MIDLGRYGVELRDLLRESLRTAGHFDTGALDESIEFRVIPGTNEITLELGANEYIKYLDDGRFLEMFFNEPRVEGLIGEMVDAIVTEEIGY